MYKPFINISRKVIEMRIYKMLGGGIVSGHDSTELIQNIRHYSFNPGESIEEFMEKTAEACKVFSGKEIRTSSIEIFEQDLVVNGFLNTTGIKNKTTNNGSK